MPFAKLADLDFYYERAGAGPPLLFISGTGGDLRVKPNLIDGPLPKAFDMLGYDQRGLGRSAKPDVTYTMADYADDAAALMDFVGWKSAKVIGVSFGGMVAQELVLRHPDKVERLVLACTSPGGAGGASYPFHEIQHLKREERARHMIPISDTRRDAAWRRANAETYAQFVAMAATDPYADEPGRAMGARRQLEARAGARHLGPAAPDRLSGADRRRPLRRHRAARRRRRHGRPHQGRRAALLRRRPPVHAAGPQRALPAMIAFLKD